MIKMFIAAVVVFTAMAAPSVRMIDLTETVMSVDTSKVVSFEQITKRLTKTDESVTIGNSQYPVWLTSTGRRVVVKQSKKTLSHYLKYLPV